MAEAAPSDPHLVADRACGTCNACCTALTIEDPALRKLQGNRCPNSRPDHGCRIYETRPETCRIFHCGWRRLKWVRETLRPDRSGVLVRLHGEVSAVDGSQRLVVEFTLLKKAALAAEGLAESIAAAVAAELPVFLTIPGRPGHSSAHLQVNTFLEGAVRTRDKPGLLRILRQLHAIGRAVPHAPLVPAEDGSGT